MTEQGVATEETEPEPTCALEGCDLPLPARPLDEQGRRRAGRRPLYCSKAHADQASRQRRATEAAAVAEPLSQAEALGRQLLPVAHEVGGLLTDLVSRLEAADAGALARIAGAEKEAGEARQDAAEAAEQARQAEQARRQALADAREAAKLREVAQREAALARGEADQVRTQAWEQVAAHERARGQSEAARQAAESAAARLVADLRVTREELEREQGAAAETTSRLATAVQEADQARAAHRAAVDAAALLESARAEALAERDRLLAERDRLLAEVERTRAELAETRGSASQTALSAGRLREELTHAGERVHELTGELAREQSQRAFAEQRAEDSRQQMLAAERRASDLQALLMALGDPGA